MNDPINSAPVRGRTLGRTIGLMFLFFASGLAVAIWALTQTRLGDRLLPAPPAPIEVDQSKINKGPGLSAPNLAVPAAPSTPAQDGDLAGRIALLEGRLAQAEARGTGGATSTGSATSRILLLIAVRRALETGRPLGGLESELNQSMGASTPHLVAAIREAAENPISLETLQQEFDTIRPQLDGSGEKWWARISNSFSNLVTVRSANERSADPAVLTKDADAALHQGAVDQAVTLVGQLPNRALASDWLSKARRYTQGMDALEKLEDEAFSTRIDEEPPIAPARVMAPVPLLEPMPQAPNIQPSSPRTGI
jgi:hypothetical protein